MPIIHGAKLFFDSKKDEMTSFQNLCSLSSDKSTYVLNQDEFTLGNIGIIYGSKNSSKSTFAFQLAADLAFRNSTFGNVEVNNKQNVVFVSLEYGTNGVKACGAGYSEVHQSVSGKMDILSDGNKKDAREIEFLLSSEENFFTWLDEKIAAGYTQIFIDNIALLWGVDVVNERRCLAFIKKVKRILNGKACLWIVTHTPKTGNVARGSGRLTNAAQCIFRLSGFPKTSTILLKSEGKVHLRPSCQTKLDDDDIGLSRSRYDDKRYLFEWEENQQQSYPTSVYAGFGLEFISGAEKDTILSYIKWLFEQNLLEGDAYGDKRYEVYEAITKKGNGRRPLMLYNESQHTWNGVCYLLMCNNDFDAMHSIYDAYDKAKKMFDTYNETISDEAKRISYPAGLLDI